MGVDDDSFEALWRDHHLELLQGAIAFDETVTARTAAANVASAAVASFTVPPLPEISLDLGAEGSSAPPSGESATSHDLVVLGTLGEGGMGKVLLARQRSLAREVAVKVLKPAAADHEGARALLREAVVMGGLEHPNIVPVHALGRDDRASPLLVMKRIEGTSWKALLHDPEHPSWKPLLEAHGDRATANLEVLMRVADAAHYAHARGVVHRDIKPENVMVGAFGEVYLVDWGIAVRVGRDRAESGGAGIRGTAAFMAPEMLDGDPSRVDARTDVYLLGATLHEALTGAARHQGATLHAVLYSAYASRPVSYGPEVPDELAALCNDATHADPARRPQTAMEFRRRLSEHLRHRASLTLSAEAAARGEALSTALAGGDGDSAHVHRLATECRFGFAQALAVWPGNARAREGLGRALRMLFEHELARENLDAARALADELDDRSDATRARLDALDGALRARREREAAALREAVESDLTRGASARLPMFGLTAALSVVLNVALRFVVTDPGAVGVGHLTAFNAGVLAVLLGALFVGRRALLVNRVNRQIAGFVNLAVAATLAHRLAVLASPDAPSVPGVIAADLSILAALSALAALTIRPWFGWMAVATTAGCLAALRFPARAMACYALSTNAMLLIGLYFSWVRLERSKD